MTDPGEHGPWLEIQQGQSVNSHIAITVPDSARYAQLGREVGLIAALLEHAKWVQVPIECLHKAGVPGKVRYYIEGMEDPVEVVGKSLLNKSLVIALRDAVRRARVEADEVRTKSE